MSETKKRKIPSPEFKAKVGFAALRGLKIINEIGQEYDVHPGQRYSAASEVKCAA